MQVFIILMLNMIIQIAVLILHLNIKYYRVQIRQMLVLTQRFQYVAHKVL